MATKAKVSSTTLGRDPRKERKTSVSTANQTKRPTKPSTTPPDKSPSHSSSTSSTTTKPVPNYLKPTASSRSDQTPPLTKSKSAKKPAHGSDNQDTTNSSKLTLNRRSSFDKPPSPSRITKSPGRDGPLRSSSSTVKTTSNVPKPTTKSGAAGSKSQSSNAKLRRSNSGVSSGSSKKEIGSSSSTSTSTGLRRSNSGVTPSAARKYTSRINSGGSKAPMSTEDLVQVLNLEADLKDMESLDRNEVGEVDKIDSIVEDSHEDLPDPKLPEENAGPHSVDTDQAKSFTGYDEGEIKQQEPSVQEIPPVNDGAEELKANVDARNEEVTGEEKKIDAQQQQHDQGEDIDHTDKVHESSVIDHQPKEGSALASEEVKTEEVIKEEKEEEHKNEDNEGLDGGSNEVDAKEAQDGDVKEETKAEEAKPQAVFASTPAGGSNKKDAPAAYNDVIETVMAKEKRKNKVKALVGAFETVIDYESK